MRIVLAAGPQDTDFGSFSATELANILAIFRGVAEDYAPFDVDVTTEEPIGQALNTWSRVAIGGAYTASICAATVRNTMCGALNRAAADQVTVHATMMKHPLYIALSAPTHHCVQSGIGSRKCLSAVAASPKVFA